MEQENLLKTLLMKNWWMQLNMLIYMELKSMLLLIQLFMKVK